MQHSTACYCRVSNSASWHWKFCERGEKAATKTSFEIVKHGRSTLPVPNRYRFIGCLLARQLPLVGELKLPGPGVASKPLGSGRGFVICRLSEFRLIVPSLNPHRT